METHRSVEPRVSNYLPYNMSRGKSPKCSGLSKAVTSVCETAKGTSQWMRQCQLRYLPGEIEYTLRGISQVILVNNQVSGLFIIVALYVGGGAWLATTALASTFIATALALRVFQDVDSVKNGLAGYNACLIGCAFPVFVHPTWDVVTFFAALFLGIVACFTNLALKPLFGSVPTFTFAFNIVIISYLLFAFNDPGALVPKPQTVINILLSPFIGISQIFIVNSALAGFLIFLGALVDSWGIALYALGAAITGEVTGYVIDGNVDGNNLNGLFGYNAALVGCAVAVFYVPTLASITLCLVASVVSSLVFYGLGATMNRAIGVPAFTLPFCTVAVACHLILSDGAVKGLYGAISPTSPEANWRQHKARLEEEKIDEEIERLHNGDAPQDDVKEADVPMRVFYGPSAVSIAVKRENIIDRQPSVVPASNNASLTSGAIGFSRPHSRTTSLFQKNDVIDEKQVNTAVLRYSTMVKRGDASASSPVEPTSVGEENVVLDNDNKKTYGSANLSGIDEESLDESNH